MKRRLPFMGVAAGMGALFAAGCSQESGLFERTTTDTWQQVETDQVDILFVVDDSHSMENEQIALANGFESFVAGLEESGNDFHLGVISTSFEPDDPDRGKLIGDPPYLTPDDDYVGKFKQRVQVGITGADKERGLQAAEYALSPAMTLGANEGFLRADAFLLVVFVSDENDCSDDFVLASETADACYQRAQDLVPVDDYALSFRSLKGDPSRFFSGVIVGPPAAEGCLDSVPGFRYWDLADLTGGIVGDICESDWSAMLAEMGLEASGVRTRFQLSDPAKPDTLEVFVNDEPVPESRNNGWSYDNKAWWLTFNGDAIPPRGSSISASYTVQPGG